jgi:tRNA-Thr(GGU) m(6)t(6)A37 methyltransferase TsaA
MGDTLAHNGQMIAGKAQNMNKTGRIQTGKRGLNVQGYLIKPVGFIRSKIKNTKDAPRFYTEGAPNATLELMPKYSAGLDRMNVGDEVIVITWLHLARRDTLRVHPRGDASRPLTGVFSTRSPARPNPLGLHRVRILQINGNNLLIGPIEAIDGTPVVDIKPVVQEANDS